MKFHKWTQKDDERLMSAIEDCQPIFDHYKQQGRSYSDANAWDAVAGRMLPDVCVTGAACRRRVEVIRETEMRDDSWSDTIEKVDAYERELAETTFDGVSEILGNMDAIFESISNMHSDIAALKKVWE